MRASFSSVYIFENVTTKHQVYLTPINARICHKPSLNCSTAQEVNHRQISFKNRLDAVDIPLEWHLRHWAIYSVFPLCKEVAGAACGKALGN